MTIILLSVLLVAFLIGCFGIEKSIRKDHSSMERSISILKAINGRYHRGDIDPGATAIWN